MYPRFYVFNDAAGKRHGIRLDYTTDPLMIEEIDDTRVCILWPGGRIDTVVGTMSEVAVGSCYEQPDPLRLRGFTNLVSGRPCLLNLRTVRELVAVEPKGTRVSWPEAGRAMFVVESLDDIVRMITEKHP